MQQAPTSPVLPDEVPPLFECCRRSARHWRFEAGRQFGVRLDLLPPVLLRAPILPLRASQPPLAESVLRQRPGPMQPLAPPDERARVPPERPFARPVACSAMHFAVRSVSDASRRLLCSARLRALLAVRYRPPASSSASTSGRGGAQRPLRRLRRARDGCAVPATRKVHRSHRQSPPISDPPR